MKYLQDGSHRHQPLTRLTLGLTLVLLLAFWGTSFAMYFSRMSLDPASVVAYYNGAEAEFTRPRSAASMLETTHMHLPMMGLVLLLLTHLLIFVPLGARRKKALIVAAFAFAVLSEGGGWLVRFVSPSLATVKVVGFLGLQATLAFLLASLAVSLARPRRDRAAHGAPGSAAPPSPHVPDGVVVHPVGVGRRVDDDRGVAARVGRPAPPEGEGGRLGPGPSEPG